MEEYLIDRDARTDVLTLDLDGWEGPLDLLLALARSQKVDLREISILDLTEQYLQFIAGAHALKLEVAADYLVMAAWLAYLKSLMLLPKAEEEEPSADELALLIQLRLQRLHAMREAGSRLLARDRVGRDTFTRGAPEGLKLVHSRVWEAEYYDILNAYAQVKARSAPASHVVERREVMTLDEAISRVAAMFGDMVDWTRLESFLPDEGDPQYRRSALASSFAAMLELARLGKIELMQEDSFSPLMVKAAG